MRLNSGQEVLKFRLAAAEKQQNLNIAFWSHESFDSFPASLARTQFEPVSLHAMDHVANVTVNVVFSNSGDACVEKCVSKSIANFDVFRTTSMP